MKVPESQTMSAPVHDEEPPRLAPGLELVGEYEGSGLKEPPFLVRRADGQVIQLTRLLFLIASCVDGRRRPDELAREVSQRYGRELDANGVRYLIEKKLRPAGVIESADGSSGARRVAPILGLRFRTRVIPAGIVNALTMLFYPLFLVPVVTVILVMFAALDIWLFFVHGTAQPVRAVIYEPAFVLLVFALTVLSAVFHEFGHAAACRYGGGRPGAMGVGIYLVWPAFFTDVTDAYRLSRTGRLRTDLGGVYFNAVFCLATASAYFITQSEALLVVVILQHFQMIYQFLPFLRLDGYYVVADLTGVPDLFSRIRPTLQGLVPWRQTHERARELKPWVRTVVTLWVMTTLMFLAYMMGAVAVAAPSMAATAVDSLSSLYGAMRGSFGNGDLTAGMAGAVRFGALFLPLVGSGLMVGRIGIRAARGILLWSHDSPVRTSLVAGVTALAGAVLMSWWPRTDFTPIGPSERWTLAPPIARTLQAAGEQAPSLPGMFEGLIGETNEPSDGSESAARGSGEREPWSGAASPRTDTTAYRSPASTWSPSPTPSVGQSASPSPTPPASPTQDPSPTAGPTQDPNPTASPSP